VLEWPSKLDVNAAISDGWRPTPFHEFILKIHSRCDLSCRYCYVYEMTDQSWRSQPKRMSAETVTNVSTRIAEHVRSHSLSDIRVTLHGGEPLLAGRDFIRAVVTAVRAAVGPSVRVDFRLQTNGILLDAAFLKLFDELAVRVGVSVDGDANAHDRHRRRANGEGSYAAVVRGLVQLTSDPFRHLFNGLLCTIDPRNGPVATYEALLRFSPPAMDFLLPHGNWSTPPPGRVPDSPETPYGDWLVAVFDRWYRAPRQETRIRLFGELMKLLLGGWSATEEIGLSPVAIAVVETDGAIQQSDILKSAYHGAPMTGLHVARDSFDRALLLPAMAARQLGDRALGAVCRSCRIRRACGGGLYAHRYKQGTGFLNPSVYCPDLMRLITHVHRVLENDVATLRKETR
jgi:uncharacterized protein